MITDARTLGGSATIETDVCIVGAGAAGLTIACELAAHAVEACVLESGGAEPDFETQSLAQGAITGLPYYPLDANRQRAFGGTLRLWAGWCRPLDELDFAERPWVPGSGWPVARDELASYYGRAHERLGLGPPQYELDHWERELGAPRVAIDEDLAVTRVYHLAEPRWFIRESRGLLRRAESVRVLTHANLTEIESDDAGGAATGLRVRCLGGRAFRVVARRYVLATGAVENARLLLASRRAVAEGLGNRHDQVGRCFMEHIHCPSGKIRLTNPHAVAPALYFRTGRGVIARLYLPPEVQAREGLLNYNAMLEPMHSDLLRRGFAMAHRVVLSADRVVTRARRVAHLARRYVGPAAARSYRRGLPGADHPARELRLHHTFEQAPNPDSRVRLDGETDVLGVPRVRLEWRTLPIDRRTMIRGRDLIGEAFGAAGLGELVRCPGEDDSVWPPPPLQGLRGHHMGTTRMHADPRRGVVDADCRVHGIRNLFVAGSSVFPTSGAGTPTITIVALALRLADHLRRGAGQV
jgi:choline dehydrogenase-like flavoprotein